MQTLRKMIITENLEQVNTLGQVSEDGPPDRACPETAAASITPGPGGQVSEDGPPDRACPETLSDSDSGEGSSPQRLFARGSSSESSIGRQGTEERKDKEKGRGVSSTRFVYISLDYYSIRTQSSWILKKIDWLTRDPMGGAKGPPLVFRR